MKTLINNKLSIKVNPLGAELSSIVSLDNEHEYLWQADPEYWKRHSPVLFPIVGGLWNNEYKHNGQIYHLSQHGFARDKEFSLVYQSDTEIRYKLTNDRKTEQIYPFAFELEIGYKLEENTILVIWEVINTEQSDLYFQIGAHPAFNYPEHSSASPIKGYFTFDRNNDLKYILIAEKGCADTTKEYDLQLTDNLLPITNHTFDNDALIFENKQINKVTLLDVNRKPYISLQFDSPSVGLWEPPHKDSPFVCIEPWYGRCDRVGYSEEFREKDWMNKLAAHEKFSASYRIIIEK